METVFKKIIICLTFSLILAYSAVSAANESADKGQDKQELALHLLYEAARTEIPTEKAALFTKIADECNGTEYAPEALWRLSILYVEGFDEPDIPNAVKALERFMSEYPGSEWAFNVQMRLLGYYESQKDWAKYDALRTKVLESNNIPQEIRDELSRINTEAKKK